MKKTTPWKLIRNSPLFFDRDKPQKLIVPLQNGQFNICDTEGECKKYAEENLMNKPQSERDRFAMRMLRNLVVSYFINHENIVSVYRGYTDKNSMVTLISDHFQKLGLTDYAMLDIGGGNNSVIKFYRTSSFGPDEDLGSFVCRFFRVCTSEDKNGSSARHARKKLKNLNILIPVIASKFMENDGQENTYLEVSPFVKNGNLEERFNAMYDNNESIESIQNYGVSVYKELLTLYQKINNKKVWYTDLKPQNLLINDLGAICISDTKGLLISPDSFIHCNKANTTRAYHDADCFLTDQLNLRKLQCQNLALSLYECLTNEPLSNYKVHLDTSNTWKYELSYQHSCFSGEKGGFLKDCITRLMKSSPSQWQMLIEQVDSLESNYSNLSKTSGLFCCK